jgi:hypothetical protein
VEQKTHKRVTDELAEAVESIAEGAASNIHRLDENVAELSRRINDERTHRLKLAEEQRVYVDAQDRLFHRNLVTFVGRGFWSSLNWIVTGR